MTEHFDLEELVHLEQTFYDAGYADGFAHGRIHGLIEGRELGREKGFEIWEEIGFYEGFALTWKAIYDHQGNDKDRLRVFYFCFASRSNHPLIDPHTSAEEIDMEKLQRQIRSRYKALCASLGVRPTLRANAPTDDTSEGDGPDVQSTLTRKIWALDGDTKRPTMQGLSF
ncbi:hypothetical protein V8B97DRAFT_2009275 [Scleroderma yunnanense]